MIWRLVSRLLLRTRTAWWHLVYKGYCSQYDIDREFRFNGAGIQLYGDGRISLGSGSYLGELSTIQAVRGKAVHIGRHCSISHNVRIYTASALADADFRVGHVPSIEGDVTIQDGVWIGTNVYIGPGIDIGANAVVGANSVVTHSVPPLEIWGGVPARFIRRKKESG
jgi:maltose O-acetyltransferase